MKKNNFVLSTSNGAVNSYAYAEQAYVDRGELLRNGCHEVKVKSFEIAV